MTYTVEAVKASAKFKSEAITGALALVAKTNGQTFEATAKAFLKNESKTLTKKVEELVDAAAIELTKQLNKGK